MRRTLLALTTAALVLAASCGDDDAGTAAIETETEAATDTEAAGEIDTDAADPATTSSAPTELPGERIDIFPYEGAELAVVAVAADDVLNVRAMPDAGADVVAELDPLADGIIPTGHNRQLDDGAIWAEVTVEGTTGWASTAFLAHPGAVRDVTSELYPAPAHLPRGDTLQHLAELVAADAAPDGEPEPDVVVVTAPSVGDLGEITVDVTGYPDDAQLGERLHVFAEPDPGGESFTVRSVESTTLCRRGVSDGSCV